MKELDKDALLEEAIRRFPLGTKYRVKEYITGKHYLEGIVSKTPYWGNNGQEDVIFGYNGILWSSKHGWSEIVEEPKVETKFEKDKWYELKYLFNGKLCNTLAKSTNDSINEFRFEKYYDLEDKEWRTAVRFSINPEIKIIYIKELSLEEIQQYLPDGHPDKFTTSIAKEEFILPEKWCVKADSSKVVQKWFLAKNEDNISDYVSHSSYETYYFHFPLNGLFYYANETKNKNYTEITFDQFKKYVLNQEVKEEVKSMEEWSIGSYAVALQNRVNWSGTEKGDIYLITLNGSADNLTKHSNDLSFSCPRNPKEFKWFPTLQEAQKFSDELLGKGKTSSNEDNLMESKEYPEYYECVNIPDTNKNWVEGKIYKIRNSKQLESYKNFIDEAGEPNGFCPHNHKHFKPSTREAYEAQFKKDEEFKGGTFPGIGILEQLQNISFGAYQSMNMGDFHSYLKNIYSGKTRKSPDLIDKSKVEVKIKRTKVKQIKL